MSRASDREIVAWIALALDALGKAEQALAGLALADVPDAARRVVELRQRLDRLDGSDR